MLGAQVTFQLLGQLLLVPQSLAHQALGALGFRQGKRILVSSWVSFLTQVSL